MVFGFALAAGENPETTKNSDILHRLPKQKGVMQCMGGQMLDRGVRGIMGITRHLVAIGNCAEKEVIQ